MKLLKHLIILFFVVCCIHEIGSEVAKLFEGIIEEITPKSASFEDGSFVAVTIKEKKMFFYSFDKDGKKLTTGYFSCKESVRDFAVTRGVSLTSSEDIFYMILTYEKPYLFNSFVNVTTDIIKVERKENNYGFISSYIHYLNNEIYHPRIAFVKEESNIEKFATVWEVKDDQEGDFTIETTLFEFQGSLLESHGSIGTTTFLDNGKSSSSLFPSIAASEERIFITYITENTIQEKFINYGLYGTTSTLPKMKESFIEIEADGISHIEVKQNGSFMFGLMCAYENGFVYGFSIDEIKNLIEFSVGSSDDQVINPSFDINSDGSIILFNSFINPQNQDQNGLEFYYFYISSSAYKKMKIDFEEPSQTIFSNLFIEITSFGKIIVLWNEISDTSGSISEVLYGLLTSYCLDSSTVWDEDSRNCVCNIGFYPGTSFYICESCAENSYKNVIGNTECTACPENSILEEDQCLCSKGYFFKNSTTGQTCLQCAFGTYKKINGNGECNDCGVGYVSNDDFTDCTTENSQIDSGPFLALFITFTAVLTGVIVFVIVVAVIAAVVFFILLKKSNAKANRFDHIEGVDMILKEAELEQKEISSKMIPKVKVKSSSYIIDFKEIKIIKKIGQGSSSSIVYLADWNGTKCAFKGFSEGSSLVGTDETTFNEFEKEVEICVKLSHPGILQFYGASITPKRIGLLVQYCSNGDLSTFIQSKRKEIEGGYPIKEKLRLLKEIVGGMKYLHNRKLLHRDLKPENILLDENEKSKIMDFGLSKTIDNAEEKTMTKMIGTVFYMSPEVIEGINYSFPCDVYSFGIMAFVILSENFHPYGKKISQPAIMGKVVVDPQFRPEINEHEFKECGFLIRIIKKCWNFKPEERYTFEQLDVELSKKENQI